MVYLIIIFITTFNKFYFIEDVSFPLFLYVLIITFSLLFFVFERYQIREVKLDTFFSDVFVFKLSVIGLFLLIYFFLSSVSSFSLLEVIDFMEKYRNGVFKGSGFYTLINLRLIPFLLSISILCNGLSKVNIVTLLILLLSCLLLGFRVYLIIPILSILYIYQFKNFKKMFILISLILLFLVGFKSVLNHGGNEYYKNNFDYLMNPIVRIKIPYLFNDKKLYSDEFDIGCTIPFLHHIRKCETEDIKKSMFFLDDNVHEGIPYIKKYSGIAIPSYVYFYNQYGYLGVILLFSLLIFLQISIYKLHFDKKILFLIYFYFIASLIEDVFIFRSLDIPLVFYLCLLIVKRLKYT